VHAGMPVEAAVEDRMQLPWRQSIARATHHMVQLVWELLADVPESEAGETVCEVRCQLCHKRNWLVSCPIDLAYLAPNQWEKQATENE
jgi:hypothetical protein